MLDNSFISPVDVSRSLSQSMIELGTKTNVISKTILPGAKVGYVDYPMHINVGDLLIFLGAMNFFNWNKNSIPASFCLFDTSTNAYRSLEQVDVIACHGGGNFGDIYPKHQNLREEIIKRFPCKPIVIMPQSFHFSCETAMRDSARIFATHNNVTLYVRDQPSYDLARKHFSDQVFLCPDMAHRLYEDFAPVRRKTLQQPKSTKFSLMRRDAEAVSDPKMSWPGSTPSYDWTDIMRFDEKLRIERHRTTTKITGKLGRANPNILPAYHKTITSIVHAIANRIGAHNPWDTSRLHGAIFGLLLDRDINLYDNSYGKNSRYFSEWGSEMVNLACP